MPRRRNRSVRNKRPANRRNKKSNRGSRSSQHHTSIVISTLQLKQAHKKEEVYPIALNTLIDRSNIGNDADIRLIGYTLSCALATGNDCSTVSINVGHAGPWVRRGDSITDSFDQQFLEHTIRGKSCLFRKFLLGSSEKQFLNPDIATNFLYLRIRDPCGVIPGVVVKLEFRAHVIRRTPSAFFSNAADNAVDRYEDQDVSSGSNPSPSPPSGIKYVPALIERTFPGSSPTLYLGEDDAANNQWAYRVYRLPNTSPSYTVAYTNPKQTMGAIFKIPDGTTDIQSLYDTSGFDGTITSS